MLEEPPLPPLAGAWDEALLAPVAELNERLLEGLHRLALRAIAESDGAAPQVHDAAGAALECAASRRPWPPLLRALGDEWRSLDATLQRRVAACPYLLMDAGVGPGGYWEQQRAQPRDAAEPAMAATPAHCGYFPGVEGIALVRRVLLFAWHLARSNRLGARLLLCMSVPAADRIADCRLQELDALAEQRPAWIVPRWEQQPAIWRQLLHAARRGPGPRLRHAQLRGLQLLAAAGLPARGHGGPGPQASPEGGGRAAQRS